MTLHCGFTGCSEPAIHRCAYCEMPLCEKHAMVDDLTGEGEARYCKHCQAYLRRLRGDERPLGIGRRGGAPRGE